MTYLPGKVAAVFFFVAATQFFLGLLLAEALYPGYSIAQNYISDLGIGPSALIFNTSVFLLGALMMVGMYFLHRTFHIKVFTILLIVAALGSMGVGLFTENSEPMHRIAALLAFLFGNLSAIYSFRVMKLPFSLISIFLGVISLLALVLFAAQQYLGLGVGGMEHMIVYPLLMWIIGFSGYLFASPEKS